MKARPVIYKTDCLFQTTPFSFPRYTSNIESMVEVLENKDGRAIVTDLDNGKRHLKIKLRDPATFSPRLECETAYPIDLIQLILDVKGAAWVCDEITRDEDPDYVALHLEKEMRAYFSF